MTVRFSCPPAIIDLGNAASTQGPPFQVEAENHISSVLPLHISTAGGATLTIIGYGFKPTTGNADPDPDSDTAVFINGVSLEVIAANETQVYTLSLL